MKFLRKLLISKHVVSECSAVAGRIHRLIGRAVLYSSSSILSCSVGCYSVYVNCHHKICVVAYDISE